jgi:hypothetical protein
MPSGNSPVVASSASNTPSLRLIIHFAKAFLIGNEGGEAPPLFKRMRFSSSTFWAQDHHVADSFMTFQPRIP